ncbi:hypothetical protein [Microbulbifer sp. GL-2]|uniref:hypothetical protein n=1 Tax=Microbulbifer sp. GL-2 TaxID=2591606 RepID=UPI001163CD0B|nr:hypothetical protein [Microbulbifer sp. GL-2]BBM03087.1 hypothetical protein GL2_31610 [Microbulbifer sp. GL-2]
MATRGLSWYKLAVLVSFASMVPVAITQEYEDPFSNGSSESSLSAEPGSSDSENTNSWNFTASAIAYHQKNSVREGQYFNPGGLVFRERESQLALDLSGQFSAGPYFSAYTRLALVADSQVDEAGDASEEFNHFLLEGYFSSYTSSRRLGLNIGRMKPQWSNGYNWSPANLLKPVYDRPNLDTDDLTQQQGWDMAHLDLRYGDWNAGFYVAEVEDTLDRNLDFSFAGSDYQYALVLNREGNLDTRLVLHQLEGGDINAALGLSALARDNITLRFEGAWEQQRELSLATDMRYADLQDRGYLKAVLGAQVSLNDGWDITAEYLYNEHGYKAEEWDQVIEQVDFAKLKLADSSFSGGDLQSVDAYTAFNFLIDSFGLLSVGQLRREYLFFMWGNTRVERKFQYRQSIQYNIDDQSQYHNLEFIQNWSEHFSTRLQAQVFTGCDSCEFGLIPSEHLIRLSFYYNF